MIAGRLIPDKLKNNYGYVIVFFSFLIQAIGLSLVTGFGLFFNPMLAEFGWSRATISLVTTVSSFSSGVAGISTGIMNDRFGPRIVMTIHGILFGLGFVLMSRISTPWQLYMSYGVIGGIGLSAINIVLLSTVARWFTSRRGMITGIVKAGAGLGIFIMPFIITSLIQGTGWRNTALTLGLVCMGIMIFSAQFLRRSPAQQGPLTADGGQIANNATRPGVNESGLSFREAIRTRQFWLLCVVLITFYYAFQAVQLHIVPYAVDTGVAQGSAAVIISIIGIVSIVGRLALGYIGDKWGTRLGFILCAFILITALVWLQLMRGLPMLYVFAAIYGLFHGGFTTLMTPVVASLFGTTSIGAIFGATQSLSAVIGGLGSLLTGYFYDRLGNYTVAFLVCLALAVIGLIFLLLIRPPDKVRSRGF